MPELYIKRNKQFFAPLNCCFHVFIDDEKMTTLSNGESDRFTVEAGKHTLQVRNNYFKTAQIPLEIDENQVKEMETSSMPILGWLYFFAPIILLVVVTLKFLRISMPDIIFQLALLPLFLFIVLALALSVLKKGISVKEIK